MTRNSQKRLGVTDTSHDKFKFHLALIVLWYSCTLNSFLLDWRQELYNVFWTPAARVYYNNLVRAAMYPISYKLRKVAS